MSTDHRAAARRQLRRLLTAVLVAVRVCAPAFAAPGPPGRNADQNLRARQEDQQRRQRDRQKDVFLQKGRQASRDTSLPDETPSFPIKNLVLTGDSAARFPWAQAMLDAYAGRNIGAKGLTLIVKRLTAAFIDCGYITTLVTVPEQDLSSGTVTLVLVPGRIGAFRFAADGVAGNWRTAFPVRPGDILNLRDLEQGLEQLKRVPSQDGVTMQIVPGEKSGESDIVISLPAAKRWRQTTRIDDSGIAPTGKIWILAGLEIDNPLGANDIFTYSVGGDGDRKGRRLGTRGTMIGYSLPFGNNTLEFNHYDHHPHQTLDIASLSLRYSQDIEYNVVKLSRLLSRDQTSKTNLEAKLVFYRYRSYLEDIELTPTRQNATAFQLGLSQRRYVGDAILDILVAHRFGVPWFGAQDDPAAAPTTRYGMWVADIGYTAPVIVAGTAGRYSLAFYGQLTRDQTYSSEFIGIGSRFTVRGFDGEQTLAAESGWYLRNELALPLAAPGKEAYLGLDCGAVYGPSAKYLPGKFLAGAVLGLRGDFRNGNYDIFVGWPLKKPAGFPTAGATYGFRIDYRL